MKQPVCIGLCLKCKNDTKASKQAPNNPNKHFQKIYKTWYGLPIDCKGMVYNIKYWYNINKGIFFIAHPKNTANFSCFSIKTYYVVVLIRSASLSATTYVFIEK